MANDSVPIVDIISPVITFALVIVVPSAVAIWVIYRTLVGTQDKTEQKAKPSSPATE